MFYKKKSKQNLEFNFFNSKGKFKYKNLISKYQTIFLNQVLKETIVEILNILR